MRKTNLAACNWRNVKITRGMIHSTVLQPVPNLPLVSTTNWIFKLYLKIIYNMKNAYLKFNEWALNKQWSSAEDLFTFLLIVCRILKLVLKVTHFCNYSQRSFSKSSLNSDSHVLSMFNNQIAQPFNNLVRTFIVGVWRLNSRVVTLFQLVSRGYLCEGLSSAWLSSVVSTEYL